MRTKNSIRNVITVLVSYIIIGILGFIKTRVFLNSFHEDIYSLNQLFLQIFSYLSLAEAGFGVYMVQQYYKAFAKDDKEEINSIFGTAVIYFRWLGVFIITVSLILSLFIPFLTKASISSTYIIFVFILFVIKNCVDYFMMCPRDVIQADQKLYKINWYVNGIRILENVCEIILALIGINYFLILIPGIFIRIIMNLFINKKVYKEYTWLQKNNHKYQKKHVKGMHDLIYQKLAGILFSNTDIILISAFVNPLSVVIYSAYNYITKYVSDTIYVFSSALTPSYANALLDNDKNKGFDIYTELNIMFNFIAAFFAISLYKILDSFVILWIGEKYLISEVGLILMIVIMFNLIAKGMMTVIVNSKGLFRETRNAVIMEAAINLVVSVALVHKMGISGVLIGTVSATALTTLWFIPYYVYKNIFNRNPLHYYICYLYSAMISIIMAYLISLLEIIKMNTVVGWIYGSTIYCLIILATLFIIFYISFKAFRKLMKRGIYILKEKLSKKMIFNNEKKTNKKKISILALHMGYGGVEQAITSQANMLCNEYEVEIVCVYKLVDDFPFELDKRVKIIYLSSLSPNKKEVITAIKKGKIFLALKESLKSIKILYLRKHLMKKYILNCDSDIIISTRILFHGMTGKYSRNGVITIAEEHRHHNDDKKYIADLLKSIKKINYLMPVSHGLTEYYSDCVKNKRMQTKVIYIKHMVDDIPDKIKYKTNKRLISVGRLSKEKGFADLIDIFKEINLLDKEYTLDIFGDGAEMHNIKEKIKEYNLQEKVIMHGFQKKETIRKYLANSNLYLMTSFEESFGLVLLEAMAYGVPCIAFDSAQGASEIINGKNGVLIKERDIHKYANTIVNKLSVAKKDKMSLEARKTSNEYSFSVIQKEWLEFLEVVK